MTNIQKAIGLVVAGLVVGLLLNGSGVFGGVYNQVINEFSQGLKAGTSNQFIVDNAGNVTAVALTLSGSITQTGASVLSTLTQGGGCTATSTTAAVGTLQAADVDTENCIDFTVNVADVTLTLAASTTAMCPSTQGNVRTFYIRNASTTASADIILASGTGILLKEATSTLGSSVMTIFGDTDGANYARLDVIKKADTDCEALATFFVD